jgi:sterol desaturase/sphingolipid hydroxylase (fatty acid hydroxylase superfamily)
MSRALVGFVVLSIGFAIVERIWPANRQARLRDGLATDLGYWALITLVTKPLTQVGIGLGLVLMYREDLAAVRERVFHPTSWVATQPLWAQAIAMLVIGDLVGYVMHRWFHGRRLWRFHAVHHSSTQLDWLSSVRVHPVNEWLPRITTVLVLVGLGFDPAAIAAYVPVLTLWAIVLHANVDWSLGWLGHVIASPRFHRWHHTAESDGLDKNFAGLFPWIDRVAGTYYMPTGRLPERFGIDGGAVPAGMWAQLAYPFRRAA